MQTPRPDLFTHPPHGDSPGDYATDNGRPHWMRAVFIAVIGVVALGFALSLVI